ncbi:unnamed protein product [Rhizophagus irregularis]|nr:unnamed protein product [Rhizophagus irregularis]
MMRYRDISNQVDLTSEINFFVSHGRPFRRFPPFRSPISKVPTFRSPVSKVPTFFRRFPPFRLPISKVPAFPVTHFEGFRLSGRQFRR